MGLLFPQGVRRGKDNQQGLTPEVIMLKFGNTCMSGKSDSEKCIHKNQRSENSKQCFSTGIGYSQNFTHFLVVSSTGASEMIEVWDGGSLQLSKVCSEIGVAVDPFIHYCIILRMRSINLGISMLPSVSTSMSAVSKYMGCGSRTKPSSVWKPEISIIWPSAEDTCCSFDFSYVLPASLQSVHVIPSASHSVQVALGGEVISQDSHHDTVHVPQAMQGCADSWILEDAVVMV